MNEHLIKAQQALDTGNAEEAIRCMHNALKADQDSTFRNLAFRKMCVDSRVVRIIFGDPKRFNEIIGRSQP